MYIKLKAFTYSNIDYNFVSGSKSFDITFEMGLSTFVILLVISCTAKCRVDNGDKETGNVSQTIPRTHPRNAYLDI